MILAIEVEFAIPVELEESDCRELCRIVGRIASKNTPEGQVHWQAGSGSKPRFSKVDAMFLGKVPESGVPETGEPTWDDSIFHIETCSRAKYPGEEERVYGSTSDPTI